MIWVWTGKEATKEDIFHCVGPGWKDLVNRLIDDITDLGWDGQLYQVKEKFGGLRVYVAGASDDIYERISAAEKESCITCEDCGKEGKLRSGSWIRTLCEDHANKR